jgi:fructose-1,6-bisphosphatase I
MPANLPDDALPLTGHENLTTIQSYLLAEEQRHEGASDNFTWVISAVSLAAKFIAAKIRRGALVDAIGSMGSENIQGEIQQRLDVIANEALLRCLGRRSGVAIVASEENEKPILVESNTNGERPYVVLFDPLDGSSNIDVCGGIGTIFSILRHDRRATSPEASVLQRGLEQRAAGYILYGPQTTLVLTTGHGVQQFVLDPEVGQFLLTDDNIRIPAASKNYSVNEAYSDSFPKPYQDYLAWAHTQNYSSRYAGAMVADVHRTLLKGGIFFYPPTAKSPNGKLRLMYEANPMAMIIEQAGGLAFSDTQRILEIQPSTLHERCSVILGSPDEVQHLTSRLHPPSKGARESTTE